MRKPKGWPGPLSEADKAHIRQVRQEMDLIDLSDFIEALWADKQLLDACYRIYLSQQEGEQDG